MRYFFSTGEASGELSATLLAAAIGKRDPAASFTGIGGQRMRAAGFTLWHDTRGWSSMGPIEALSRIPKLLWICWQTARRLHRNPPDLLVVVDFGAFHVRLAKMLRALGYRKPILYFFPPGAWLDNPHQAHTVSAMCNPLTPFEHQATFYRSLGLPIAYFGHPLTAAYTMRQARPAPPADGGTVAVLPGSRGSELRYHVPALIGALQLLRAARPQLQARIGVASDDAQRTIEAALQAARMHEGVTTVRGAQAALADADAAWIASGTAVLEAALCGVPTVALYILSAAQARIARRVYHGNYITIPNLILGKPVVPELLQEAATPPALAEAMERLLRDPHEQYAQLRAVRERLGPADALDLAAAYAMDLAAS